MLLRNWPVRALRLWASECCIFLLYSIKKLTRWSSGAARLRMFHFLIRFYWEIDQLELWGCELQNAILSYSSLLRNWPVGTLELPDSECFTFLLISFEKLTSSRLHSELTQEIQQVGPKSLPNQLKYKMLNQNHCQTIRNAMLVLQKHSKYN